MLALISEYILKPRLFFRVDAGFKIGLGHFIRSSALASMLSDLFHCTLLTYDLPDLLLVNSNTTFDQIILLEAPDAESLLKNVPYDSIIVLDGYNFDYDYQTILKKKGHFLVSIDDIQKTHFVSDIVINHGVNINPKKYSCERYTKLYTGLNYMMLRQPFFDIMKKERQIQQVKNLLVIMGGNDMKDISILLLKKGIDKCFGHIHFISGAGTVSFERLLMEGKGKKNVTIHKNLNANELVEVANKCDLCICTPSSISYELSCIGIGLILCIIAENQKHFYDFFIDNGLAVGCNFINENGSDKLFQTIQNLRNDLIRVNQQKSNQKSFFKVNSKENLLNIFGTIR
jgi:UDP-2,4-diacetamido-2,4,6-trideoxy-beta-L-altropyranose hydrolase